MSEEKKEADSTGLVITIFVVLVLIVAVIVVLVNVLPENEETVEDPTAVVLVTSPPPPPPTFELSPTPIPTPTRIVEGESELPDDVAFAFITPVDIVGFDPDDPTDGLNVRSGPSFNDEVVHKIFVYDLVPLYGTNESGEWCMIGMHGVEWVLCKYTRPALPLDCDLAPSVSEFISEEGCDLGSGEAG